MNEKFRDKEIEKRYWAIVSDPPKPPAGQLEGWLKKIERQNKSYVLDKEQKGSKHAVLQYTTLAHGDRYSLLEVMLETGRHHQIRVQLADKGSVIKGDLKYGASRSNPDGSISLHARSARFQHPVTQEWIEVTSPCPNDALWNFFEKKLG